MIGRVDGPDRTQIVPVDTVAAVYEAADALAMIAVADAVPLARASVSELPPVPPTSRVLCLGQNYLDHINEIKEVGRKVPVFPNIFGRWASTLAPHNGTVSVPPGDVGLDWEAELAVVIGQPMGPTAQSDAMSGILGFTAFNDITARGIQKATSQWMLGKNGDNSGPLGPEVVTVDELGDPNDLAISSRVNGETRQSANTSLMMFKIDFAIHYITQAMTLRPGDVIAMGTPAGVGAGMNPPSYMNAGDVVEVEIENIGTLTTHVV